MIVVLFGFVGLAIDGGRLYWERRILQNSVDAAALAASDNYLGVRQARYFGRRKTLFQALMVAAVANLTLVAAFGGTNDGMHRPIRTPISLLQALLGPFRAATNWCQELFRTVSRPRTPGLPSEFTALEMALSRPGL